MVLNASSTQLLLLDPTGGRVGQASCHRLLAHKGCFSHWARVLGLCLSARQGWAVEAVSGGLRTEEGNN